MTGLFGCESPRTAGKGVMLPVESSRLDIRSHFPAVLGLSHPNRPVIILPFLLVIFLSGSLPPAAGRVRKSQNGRKGGHAARRIIQVGYTISSIS
jgi:hypothetical protein